MVTLETLMIIASVGLVIAMTYLRIRWFNRAVDDSAANRRERAFSLPEDSALDQPIDYATLREQPAALESLAAKVTAVHVMRLPVRGGDDLYEGYVIDTNGLPASFALDADRAVVFRQASWMAEQLGVPFSDDT